jgi:hypothetical protein
MPSPNNNYLIPDPHMINNDINYKINELENKIKKLELRISYLENEKNNNYIEPDTKMYML